MHTDDVIMTGSLICEFYIFRCGHCMKFAPEFEEASEILKTVAPSVALLKVGTCCM